MAIRKVLEIPASIIERHHRQGYGKIKLMKVGICYAVLDAFIQNGLGNQQDIDKIQKMIKRTEHKRQFPPRLERHS